MNKYQKSNWLLYIKIEMKIVFPFVFEEVINCEDIKPRRTSAELSYRKVRLASITPKKMFYFARLYVYILGLDQEGFQLSLKQN